MAVAACGLLAMAASADPDPPASDGGTTYFTGDWFVDAGDHLSYINQTIVLTGNLTINGTASLDLTNVTLAFNASFDGEFSMLVRPEGWLNVSSGSTLKGESGRRWFGKVHVNGHLQITSSAVQDIGFYHTLGMERAGILSQANDTHVDGSTFIIGHAGLILDGTVGARVVNTTFRSMTSAAIMLNASRNVRLEGLVFEQCNASVAAVNCTDLRIVNCTMIGGNRGITAFNSTLTITSGVFKDQLVLAVEPLGGSITNWTVSGISQLVNTTLNLRGILDVTSSGSLNVTNSTLAILNDLFDGQHGIKVNGSMRVTALSTVTNGSSLYRYWWDILDLAFLELSNSTVTGAGWNDTWPGLVIRSTGNVLSDSVLSYCYYGMTVLGDDNQATGLSFSYCYVGTRWNGSNGSLTRMSADNCTSIGFWLNGTRRPILIDISCRDSGEGIRADSSCLLPTISNFTGTNLTTGIRISSDDLKVLSGNLNRIGVGVWIENASDVSIAHLIISNATGNCIYANVTIRTRIWNCTLESASSIALEAHASANLTIDDCKVRTSPTLIFLNQSDSSYVMDNRLDTSQRGLVLASCDNATISRVTFVDVLFGLILDGSHGSNAQDCAIQRASGVAVHFTGGAQGNTVSKFRVSDSHTAVYLTGDSTSDNLIANLTLNNITVGLNASGAGTGNILEWTTFNGTPLGITVMEGSEVIIKEGAFWNSTVAILTDKTSWANWSISGTTQLHNSSANFRGLISVLTGGSLNITGSEITFISAGTIAPGIVAVTGSEIMIKADSRLVAAGSGTAFYVHVRGDLEARNCRFVGGGDLAMMAALWVEGDGANIHNVTFTDCDLALEVTGSFTTVSNCTFTGNERSLQLGLLNDYPDRLAVTGCTFLSSGSDWDVKGTFNGSILLKECSFEGRSPDAMGVLFEQLPGNPSAVTVKNVTFANYTYWGFRDSHMGGLLMEDCAFVGANASVGDSASYNVRLMRLTVTDCILASGVSPFVVEDCTFVNGTLRFQGRALAGTVQRCTFDGSAGATHASLEIEDNLAVLINNVTISSTPVGLRVLAGSEVHVTDCNVSSATVAAVDVNSSMVSMESCDILRFSNDGVRCWGISGRVELRNCTITADPGRTGYDVLATASGDVWLLNTPMNRSAVSSSSAGRVEVLWFVTIELRLPWGPEVENPTLLALADALGTEVLNITWTDEVFILYEFVDANGVRTNRTPHRLRVEDAATGTAYLGDHGINVSQHLVVGLLDVEAPIARAGPDQVVDEDLVVYLSAATSTDNDPTFPSSATFNWTFNEYGTPVELEGQDANYVFSVPGTFQIILTVKDAHGNVMTDTVFIQVSDKTAPLIRFGGNVTIDEDEEVIFDASATTDNNPAFNATRGTFLWNFYLDDEPTPEVGATVSVVFEEPGNFSGTLTVWDDNNNDAEVEFWVLVLDVTPPIIRGLRSMVVFEPAGHLLDASTSSDNVGIVEWRWTVILDGATENLVGPAPNYTFAELGTYDITLTVEDAAGNQNQSSAVVVYDDVPIIYVTDRAVAMAGETLTVGVTVVDSFGTPLVVSISEGPEEAFVEWEEGSYRLVWTPSSAFSRTATPIDIEAHDGYISSQVRVIVWVNPPRGTGNQQPVITSDPPLGARKAVPYIYSVEVYDPDGDVLGFELVEAPEGMSISTSGDSRIITWDPPYQTGTVVVRVHLVVTDGRALVHQEWDIRWREDNKAPDIGFELLPMEVRVLETFWVALTPFLTDPSAFDLDADDPNLVLVWEMVFDEALVELIQEDGLEFQFQALSIEATTFINFTVTDPSGASDTTSMTLTILPAPKVEDDKGWTDWLPWIALLVLVILGVLGGVVATRRRRPEEELGEAPTGEEPEFGPAPMATPEESETLSDALAAPEPSAASKVAVGFVELEGVEVKGLEAELQPQTPPPLTSRVIDDVAAEGEGSFVVEGVAVLARDGRPVASTGMVDEVLGPYQEALGNVLSPGDGETEAMVEVEGRRVLVAFKQGTGVLCVLRGREDASYRKSVMEALDSLLVDTSEGAALNVIGDLVAIAGKPARAEVVKGAWTARIKATVGFKGSMVVLSASLRNDTQETLHNVRLRLAYDKDALSMSAIEPKLLASKDKISLGNMPPGKEQKLRIHFMPELCISSNIDAVGEYTDIEGRQVVVPAKPMPIEVECPYVGPGLAPNDEELLELAADGLSHQGRRAFVHGMEVPREDIFKLAVRKAAETGAAKVKELDEPKLMRSEAWLMGVGEGGTPRILVRISSHGTDSIIEVFVASADSAIATGLLTHITTEVVDAVASEFKGLGFDRIRDTATLEDLEVWPSLLDYSIEGE
jgi:PKD repeat protein